MSKLSNLDLSSNRYTGNIPTQLRNMNGINSLNLSANQLTGTIPDELGDLIYILYLDLSSNRLTGSIPAWFENFTWLESLSLSSNLFSGNIPPELGNMSWLFVLDLSDNYLIGDVPASFTQLATCGPNDTYYPCSGEYGLDLGYNRLNVPAPEPPAAFLDLYDPDWYLTQGFDNLGWAIFLPLMNR